MRRIREVLRLRAELGPNLSAISAGAKLARSTVRAYLERAAAAGLDATAADGLSETALEAALYPPSAAEGRTPDWAEVDQELRRHSTSPASCSGWKTRRCSRTVWGSASSSCG
jgi:transposase